jgi:hypothetical protein
MDTKKMNPFIPGGPHFKFRRGNGLLAFLNKPLQLHEQNRLLIVRYNYESRTAHNFVWCSYPGVRMLI